MTRESDQIIQIARYPEVDSWESLQTVQLVVV